MRVLMMPDYRRDNPYQSLLAAALEKQGVRVLFPQGYRRGLPLVRAVRDNWPVDILHLHWLNQYVKGQSRLVFLGFLLRFWLDLLLVRLAGCRIVWTVHNLIPHEARFPGPELCARALVCRLASRVLVHGRTGAALARTRFRCPASRIEIVPLGAYGSPYQSRIARGDARTELQLPVDQRVYLYFGVIRAYKGVEALLKTWNALQLADASLLVVGSCEDPELLRRLAHLATGKATTRFVNAFVPDTDVHRYFSAADVAVFPFERILTSSSVALALSFALPVIAPRLGDVPELVGDAGDLLYEPGDRDGLRRKLQLAYQMDLRELEERSGRAGARRDWDAIGARMHALYTACFELPLSPSSMRWAAPLHGVGPSRSPEGSG